MRYEEGHRAKNAAEARTIETPIPIPAPRKP
jgi:hypothetical protein